MLEQRDANGVRVRVDGKGDAWAKAHRNELGATFNMTDVDGLVGMVGFAANTGDRLFIEYVPDNYRHRLDVIRTYATVALFDRKATRAYAFGDSNRVSLSWYLDMCRRLARTQPKPPKFLLVIGRDNPPWEMIELDITTGDPISENRLEVMNWKAVWRQIGLTGLRDELRAWLK